MRTFWTQTGALIAKDLRQWARDRQALFGPMLIPLVLMLICTVLFGYGGDEWNIGLIVEGQGPGATQFAATIEELHGNISPYFRVITRDPAEARRLVEAGRLQLVITVPADFDQRLHAGEPPQLHTQLFNINTDMTKNVRLRLERAIQDFAAARKLAPVTITQVTTRSTDVWRRAFIAAGALIVALLVGAALNTAIIVAREWERNTAKEIRLAPHALAPIVTGKLVAGLLATMVNVAVTLAVAVTLFDLTIPMDRWLPLVGSGLLVAIAAAGVGLGLGAWLRDYRTLQPLLLVTAAGSFFAAGGYGSVATLPPAVRTFDRFWPPAYVFEAMHALMHMAVVPDLTGFWVALPLAALLGVSFGLWMVRRALYN
jgi:ABC-type polysaccharide/polyol phosphate export permease